MFTQRSGHFAIVCKAASVEEMLLVGGVLVLVFGVFLAAVAIIAWRKPERSHAWWTAGLAGGLALLAVALLRPSTVGTTAPGGPTWAYLFISYGLAWTLALPAILWLIVGLRPSSRVRVGALAASFVPLLGLVAALVLQLNGDPCAGLS